MKYWLVLLLIPVLLLSGCFASEQIKDPLYFSDIWVTDNTSIHTMDGSTWSGGVSGDATWGAILGILSNQTDLQNALNAKQNSLGFTPENIDNKGEANGYTPLDSESKVPVEYLGSLPKSGGSLFLKSDRTWSTPTASAAWGGITGTLSDQSDLNTALNNKLSSELDPVFTASPAFTIESSNISAWNALGGDETDPVFVASVAYSIASANITAWNAASAASHSHANIATLNAIQEAFTTALKTSYDWLVTNITAAWKTSVDNFIASKGQANGLAGLGANSAVAVANGGTGAVTKATGMAGLSPLTTKGDIFAYNTDNTRLPLGSNTQVLTVDTTTATGMKWAAPSSAAASWRNGIATKNINDASTTQNIAHGLGRVPVYVKITGTYVYASTLSGESIGVYNGTTNSGTSIFYTEGTTTATIDNIYTSTTQALGFTALGSTNPYSGANRQTGVITVDATNIIITWTKAGTVASNVANLLWEVQ